MYGLVWYVWTELSDTSRAVHRQSYPRAELSRNLQPLGLTSWTLHKYGHKSNEWIFQHLFCIYQDWKITTEVNISHVVWSFFFSFSTALPRRAIFALSSSICSFIGLCISCAPEGILKVYTSTQLTTVTSTDTPYSTLLPPVFARRQGAPSSAHASLREVTAVELKTIARVETISRNPGAISTMSNRTSLCTSPSHTYLFLNLIKPTIIIIQQTFSIHKIAALDTVILTVSNGSIQVKIHTNFHFIPVQ